MSDNAPTIYGDGSFGRQISADSPRQGFVDDGLIAFPERVELARRHWPEGRREDFEAGGRRSWTDTATGTRYREVGGCGPLISPHVEDVDVWFQEGGKLVLLTAESRGDGSKTVIHGAIIAREVTYMARPKYLNAADWRAVAASGGDPGPRPRGVGVGTSLDPTERLLGEIASGGPKPVPISSVQLEQKAVNERRRKANQALEDAGVRPQPWV